MSTIDDGGPAFPQAISPACNPVHAEFDSGGGMTLRDWFAGLAMQGMLSCQDFMNELCRCAESKDVAREEIAYWSYRQADAMLERRNS